jgi:hypothetical protein
MESFFTQMMLGLRLACVLVPKLHNKSSASDSLQNGVEFGACSHPPTHPPKLCNVAASDFFTSMSLGPSSKAAQQSFC